MAIYKNKTKQTIITHSHFIYNATTISLYVVYISRLSTLLFYYLFYFIVYFNIPFYFIVYFSILFISLSLVSFHAVFLFLLCTEHWNKNSFPPGLIKYSHSESDANQTHPLCVPTNRCMLRVVKMLVVNLGYCRRRSVCLQPWWSFILSSTPAHPHQKNEHSGWVWKSLITTHV